MKTRNAMQLKALINNKAKADLCVEHSCAAGWVQIDKTGL